MFRHGGRACIWELEREGACVPGSPRTIVAVVLMGKKKGRT